MQSSFNLAQEELENAQIYDKEKSIYITNYLTEYFQSKLTYLNGSDHRIKCPQHDMEKYTVSDKYSRGHHGFCLGNTFADWQDTLSMHCNAKFNCEKEFLIGYTFTHRIKELISVLDQLHKTSNEELIKGIEFSNSSRLTVNTGFMQNNFSTIHSYFLMPSRD